MKKRVWLTLLLTFLMLSLVIVTGCAKKKSLVTSDVTPGQDIVSEQPLDTAQRDRAKDAADAVDKEADAEKWVDLEKAAAVPSPVRNINFDFDSSSIRPDAREILKTNAYYFMRNRVSSIIIEGHCDERGTAEYNMALGERRAQETKKFLVNLGINESIVKTVSYGEERPLDPNNNEEAWTKNRRAHFVVNP
ncbi:18k peptidoglycan-associated outer membrane lipoprotein [hydrocarbon metagenome]|uniref:18k peptidoglycan-associated outer membrane lipoprotein n=1 Tax=hydrocarbon metagenome TaxID=938273 RepID=A0A0W8FQB9_9ZZZZ